MSLLETMLLNLLDVALESLRNTQKESAFHSALVDALTLLANHADTPPAVKTRIDSFLAVVS